MNKRIMLICIQLIVLGLCVGVHGHIRGVFTGASALGHDNEEVITVVSGLILSSF